MFIFTVPTLHTLTQRTFYLMTRSYGFALNMVTALKPRDQRFFQLEIIINFLVLSASFEYLCYGSRPLEIFTLSVLGSLKGFNHYSAGIDFRRQNLTSDSDV